MDTTLLRMLRKANPGTCDQIENLLLPVEPDDKYDQRQLGIGAGIEMEHPDVLKLGNECAWRIAKHIAKNHLDEFPDYYDRLAKLEKEAKQFWKGKKRE